MAEEKSKKTGEHTGVNPPQVSALDIEAKKEPGQVDVEPIKPGDKRVARSTSLLGTCYTSTNRPSKPPED